MYFPSFRKQRTAGRRGPSHERLKRSASFCPGATPCPLPGLAQVTAKGQDQRVGPGIQRQRLWMLLPAGSDTTAHWHAR